MIVLVLVIVADIITQYCNAIAVEKGFSHHLLSSYDAPPPNATIDYLVRQNYVESAEWGCLHGCHHPHHSTNKWHDLEVSLP